MQLSNQVREGLFVEGRKEGGVVSAEEVMRKFTQREDLNSWKQSQTLFGEKYQICGVMIKINKRLFAIFMSLFKC